MLESIKDSLDILDLCIIKVNPLIQRNRFGNFLLLGLEFNGMMSIEENIMGL